MEEVGDIKEGFQKEGAFELSCRRSFVSDEWMAFSGPISTLFQWLGKPGVFSCGRLFFPNIAALKEHPTCSP